MQISNYNGFLASFQSELLSPCFCVEITNRNDFLASGPPGTQEVRRNLSVRLLLRTKTPGDVQFECICVQISKFTSFQSELLSPCYCVETSVEISNRNDSLASGPPATQEVRRSLSLRLLLRTKTAGDLQCECSEKDIFHSNWKFACNTWRTRILK